MPTPGVDPLKNFAMSACVPVGVYVLPCGATVTVIRDERNTSPLAPDATVHPLASGLAEMPTPAAAVASCLRRLMLTRTMFSAYGSTITVAGPRETIICCACIAGAIATSIAALAAHPAGCAILSRLILAFHSPTLICLRSAIASDDPPTRISTLSFSTDIALPSQ